MARRYFLDYFFFTTCLVAGQKYALKGGEVFLKPDITGHPDGILWKHDGNKVAEFNGQEQQVYAPFDNRITLDWVSAKLDITDLRIEDSGEYELDVEIKKRLYRSAYKVEVIDKVAKPTISCEMNEGSGSNMSGNLVCSAESERPRPLMTFEWRTSGSVKLGPKLLIPLGDEHNKEEYSCYVSNPLSSETATFTAKDCYPDKSSSDVLIAASVISVLVVLMVLGILLCKYRHKACFAKDDLEKRYPAGATEGPDKEKVQGEENNPLLDRAPTLPSTQPLRQLNHAYDMEREDVRPREGHVQKTRALFEQNNGGQKLTVPESNADEHKETASPPSPQRSEAPPLEHNEPAEEKVPQCDSSDSEKERDPDTANALDDLGVSSPKSDVDLPVAPAQPEPDEKADVDKEAQSAPASAETSAAAAAAQPLSSLTESSPNMAPKDTAGEHKEDANSDQVSGETAEKNASDSSGEEEERNESDDSSKHKLSPAAPELRYAEPLSPEQDLNSSQEDTNTSEGKQREAVKLVSENENETDSVGDQEETDKEQDLYLAASQQPRSPTPTEADNGDMNGFQESPDGEEEPNTSHDSDEPGRQPDKGEGETVEDKNEVQWSPNEEKLSSESLSEDKE